MKTKSSIILILCGLGIVIFLVYICSGNSREGYDSLEELPSIDTILGNWRNPETGCDLTTAKLTKSMVNSKKKIGQKEYVLALTAGCKGNKNNPSNYSGAYLNINTCPNRLLIQNINGMLKCG